MPNYIDQLPPPEEIIAVVHQYNKPVTIRFEGCECFMRAAPDGDSITIDFEFCKEHGQDPELKQSLINGMGIKVS